MELSDKKFAVLIDADNISHRKIKDILDEIANYGTPTIKRIYGDFTDPKFAAWKSILLENSITPIQQYAYTTGKNATDSALIIDAMDILHKESVNGFCIVSSDSDYTRLASRIRESGREVLGFGEKKTPKPFIKSCDKFIYVEILGQPAAPTPALAPAPGTAPAAFCSDGDGAFLRTDRSLSGGSRDPDHGAARGDRDGYDVSETVKKTGIVKTSREHFRVHKTGMMRYNEWHKDSRKIDVQKLTGGEQWISKNYVQRDIRLESSATVR